MPVRTKEEMLDHAKAHGLRKALIVTALALEMRAVRAHVKPLGSVRGRGTIYECGQFSGEGSEWLVVVVESGAGTHLAHAVVTSAQIDFHGFELMVFVGIAASRKSEAPIGSVVASSILYSPLTGKFDAERGHTARPRPVYPDRDLVATAQKVERDAEWPARIRNPLRETLPEINSDDYPKPVPPHAFIAPIASVEAVSADPRSEPEEHIAQSYSDTLAIEMEGYGAAYAANLEETPLIVVRGISDMRSGKKAELDAIHQPVAAAHASAFAFELINVWGQFRQIESGKNISAPQSPMAPPPAASTPPYVIATPPMLAANALVPAKTGYLSVWQPNILVLNFAGTAADFPPPKVEQIVETLRSISSNPDLRVIKTEEGSFRMLLESKPGDREKIDTPDVHATLLREHSAKLVGVLSREEYSVATSLEDSLKRASRDLLEWPQTLPDGTHLARPEADQLLATIENSDSSTTALLGPPGSGKSALLASLGKELLERCTPILAIKADLLEPAIQTEEGLQDALLLPDLPSSLLINISRLRPVVLLIDQLDALADYVDLRTGRLSVLLNLVRRLGERRNIHIVLSSRTFEFDHDTRLKSVRAESLALALPAWSTVLPVLERNAIKAAGWPVDAQDLMRSPQALSTYLKLTKKDDAAPFRTYQSMLDQLWRQQILAKPNGARLATIAGEIAEHMADMETLWLAAARYDDRADELQALIASGILTDYDGMSRRVGFTHQTVFAHALARAFAHGEHSLSSYILERQPSLFIRPKLWASLTYLRDVEPATYQKELKSLWSTPNLRLHLRLMLIEFMGQQPEPTAIETGLYEQALASGNRRTALLSILGSPGWFNLFAQSHVAKAMVDKDEAGSASAILDRAWSFAFETVVSLITKNWLPDKSCDGLLWNILQNCPTWDEEVIGLAEKVIERTPIAAYNFEFLASAVGVEHPEVALRLIEKKLGAELDEAIKTSDAKRKERAPEGATENELMLWQMRHSPEKPLTDLAEQRDGWDFLDALAKDHPALFLQHVWPWFRRLLAALREVRQDGDERPGFAIEWGLDFRFPDENSLDLPEPPLLGSINTALEALAEKDKQGFLDWLAKNGDENATPAQRLFANALGSQPETYAERAAEFLLEDKNRFHLGSEDIAGTTKRLVAAVSPYWLDETLNRFVKEVIYYKPQVPTERTGKSLQYFNDVIRKIKLGILSALPQDRISQQARLLILEERRRFPDDHVGVRFSGPSFIGSPISADSLSKGSDDDVLNAFRRVPDASGWDHPSRWMKGGNIQLSREFAEFAKTAPERAAQIIGQLEPSFGTRAAGYALDAMAENADPALIVSLIQKLDAKGFEGDEFRRTSANAIQRLIQRDVSIDDGVLITLQSWLERSPKTEPSGDTNDDEAENDGLTDQDEQDEKGKKNEDKGGSVLWSGGGISVLPAGNFPVLEAITRILLQRKKSDELLAVYREHLNGEEESDVWRALLRYIRFIYPADLNSLEAFLKSLFGKHPQILASLDAYHMLAYLRWRLPNFLHPIVLTWRDANSRRLRQVYGEFVGLVALTQPEPEWPKLLLDEILAADDMSDAKLGAAYAAVNVWPDFDDHRLASEILVRLVAVADQAIWSAIFDLFRLVDEVTPEPEWISLLEAIAKNVDNIGNVNSTFVVERLQTLLPHHALLIAKLAQGLINGWRSDLGDVRTSTAMAARELVDLAITLHRLGPETREQGTELFEQLLVINAYTARETLDEIDNRFREAARPMRRRLPRRNRKPRKRS